MCLKEVKKNFIKECYSSRGEYLKARRADYCKAQFEWSCYIDALCKSGIITQKQYDKATF